VNPKNIIRAFSLTLIALLGLLLAYIYLPFFRSDGVMKLPEPTPGAVSSISTLEPMLEVAPTSIWSGLQERTPHPYTTPLPAAEFTAIDGVYAKFDESWPQWWSCRRCADYRPAGGIWKLRFDQGVMRIHYNVTSWVSIASYTASGDRLFIFNDPYCPEAVGEYRWVLEDRWGLSDRRLVLQLVSDSCSFGLRGENLSAQLWESCFPPNDMTAVSDHWHKPLGCEDPDPALLKMPEPHELPVVVDVHGGDAKHFAVQPDVFADANRDEVMPPDGIEIRHDESSIPYGLNRVLWGESSWVEASTELPFEAMGVQIFGDNTIGWARILFDGQEVWRGDTQKIWSEKARFGGYIEVSGFEPGKHTLRIESLGVDYRPVTVAFFGFSEEKRVSAEDPLN
jgi:hypothetical protein